MTFFDVRLRWDDTQGSFNDLDYDLYLELTYTDGFVDTIWYSNDVSIDGQVILVEDITSSSSLVVEERIFGTPSIPVRTYRFGWNYYADHMGFGSNRTVEQASTLFIARILSPVIATVDVLQKYPKEQYGETIFWFELVIPALRLRGRDDAYGVGAGNPRLDKGLVPNAPTSLQGKNVRIRNTGGVYV